MLLLRQVRDSLKPEHGWQFGAGLMSIKTDLDGYDSDISSCEAYCGMAKKRMIEIAGSYHAASRLTVPTVSTRRGSGPVRIHLGRNGRTPPSFDTFRAYTSAPISAEPH